MKLQIFVLFSSLSLGWGYSTGLFGGSSPWIVSIIKRTVLTYEMESNIS